MSGTRLTAEILSRLKSECPFPDIFKDTVPDETGLSLYPRSKIGHFRADHNGWHWSNTLWLFSDISVTAKMKEEIDATYAALTAKDALADLPTLTQFCRAHPDAGVNYSDTEFNFFLEGQLCNYWIRLITRPNDYNMYLNFYAKPDPNARYFRYLEDLRDSGETNMWGAAAYLARDFPELSADPSRSREILCAWIRSKMEECQ